MSKTSNRATDGRVYLRERDENGRERYAGSLSTETLSGPGSTANVSLAPAKGSEARTGIDLDLLAARSGAVVGQRVPVQAALAANFLGDDVEAEFCIDGEYVSGTRAELRSATFGLANEILFCDELGEHYVAYTADGDGEEIHLVNCGPVVFPEDDLDGLAETLDVLSVDAESDSSSGSAFATLDRFSETGEAGQIALVEAIGVLISIREQVQDGYDLGIWNAHEGSLRDGFETLRDALPLHVIEAVAQEFCGMKPHDVQRRLADGRDPWA